MIPSLAAPARTWSAGRGTPLYHHARRICPYSDGCAVRVLVLYCHPVETSFHAALHRRAVAALTAAGHSVDDCDLYAEGFDPVLSRAERLHYHDTSVNRAQVEPYVRRLLAAEALVLCHPVW